jgi:hypothetical protein
MVSKLRGRGEEIGAAPIWICFADDIYGVRSAECISLKEETCLLALTLADRTIERQLIDSPRMLEHNIVLIEGTHAVWDAIRLHALKDSPEDVLLIYVDDDGQHIAGWETHGLKEMGSTFSK